MCLRNTDNSNTDINYKKMEYSDKKIKANIAIKVDNLTDAAYFMGLYKRQGAKEIRDKETRNGGRKYDLNGKIIYIYMV